MNYHRPDNLAEALALRASAPMLPLAGGTDVYPARAGRIGWGDASHPDVLDLSAIPGLDAIRETPAGWRIGGGVTWTALAEAPLPPLFDGLRAAGRQIGGRQVQNRGTLVGNLCTASPAGDGIPNLLALDASVAVATSAGEVAVPVAAFLTGYRRTALPPDALVIALHIPRLHGARGGFVKLGARHSLVISIAMVAGVVALDAADRIATARIAVGACSAVAQRLPALEAALRGVSLPDAASTPAAAHVAALEPIDDIRGSAAYREDVVVTLLRDLLAGMAAP